MRVREREGYPLHCCVTGNLIEREREGGRQEGSRGGGRVGWREGRRSDAMQKALSESRCCWNYRGLGRSADAARPSLQSVGLFVCVCVWVWGGWGSSEREHIVHKVEESSQGHVECALCNV